MSIDTHSPTVAGFRCEAVTADTIASPCLHGRLANIGLHEPAGVDHYPSLTDDPAILIGLALAFVRQGPLLDGHVAEPLMLGLNVLADGGNPACRLLVDWLRSRNRGLDLSRKEHPTGSATVTFPADIHPPRRLPRERVLAASPMSGHRDRQRRIRTRPRDPVRNPETAIIAAETGGRADG
ncbi:hypothetical protein E0H35_30605 [Rhizobium leguminosarum bv. viciae]|uniref:hypothetical protein n=1 Tax=Rhizobium leguminosarum TaxID=384 RepID=UPI00103BDB62|nr:hypothetical protein [Rhizobium leguminosarum]MBY5340445.1 hypothetical protein [Rhizobium leguminosarum]NKK49346.1 hypothetical protein [Rhizobium leguminosarum bv. viciae]TBY90885.1 hypothetical protein E0H35_30605 [Rhizobium leguminosarum bv. viciae]